MVARSEIIRQLELHPTFSCELEARALRARLAHSSIAATSSSYDGKETSR